jgi:hypothetical protein
MSIQELSDYLGVSGWFITGAWFIRQHFKRRDDFPRVNVHSSMREIAKSEDKRIVEVIAEIENTGEVRHKFRSIVYDIRGSALENMSEKAGPLDQVHLPILVARDRRFFPKSWEYSFVDAGQKSTYRHLISIPTNVKLVQLKVTMIYEDEESDFHRSFWHGAFID